MTETAPALLSAVAAVKAYQKNPHNRPARKKRKLHPLPPHPSLNDILHLDEELNPSPIKTLRPETHRETLAVAHAATTALEEYDSNSSGSDTSYERHEVQLSNLDLPSLRIDHSTSKTMTVTLKQGESIAVIGLYDLWIKKGCVSLWGARLLPNKRLLRVFAPSTHSLPTVICESAPSAQVTLISFQSGMRFLRAVSPLFGHIWNDKCTSGLLQTSAHISKERSFSVLYWASEDPRKRHLSSFDATHFKVAPTLSMIFRSGFYTPKGTGARIMICGPKSTGKSSLCQYLINRFVTEETTSHDEVANSVALLDLDPGKPFFCSPGQISFSHLKAPWFGPAFAHPNIVPKSGNTFLRAHHVGVVPLKDDPYTYVQCAMDLLSHYEGLLKEFPSCPLVINTPAWMAGAGLEVITELISSFRITTLMFTSTHLELQDPFRTIAEKHNFRFVPVASASSEQITRSPNDLQTMQMISYFHLALPERSGLRWFREPLYKTRPWVVHYSGEQQAISAVVLPNHHHDSEFLYRAVEGSIVNVVLVEDATAFQETSTEKRKPNQEVMGVDEGFDASNPSIDIHRCPTTNIPFAHARLPPSTSFSLGLALVRAIDIESQQLHLNTPISASILVSVLRKSQRIVLVRSNSEVPEWAFQEEHFSSLSRDRRFERMGEAIGEDDTSLASAGIHGQLKWVWERERRPFIKYERAGESLKPDR